MEPGRFIVVAETAEKKIIAFGSIVPSNSEPRAVYVAANHVRRGVGRAILHRLFEMARQLGVKELSMNASLNAVRFYEQNGFTSLERAVHTASNGLKMDCMRMQIEL